MKIILLLLVSFSGYSQKLHHQMLSSQGASTHLTNGVVVKQTVGQQSPIGNTRTSNFIVGQGFQQSSSGKSVNSQNNIRIKTIVYPNPFIDKVNFQFSVPILGLIKIMFYDISGKLVYNIEKAPVQNTLTIDNLSVAEGEYFVKLSAKNYTYSTNLLKTK
jgi:hypothetical protein